MLFISITSFFLAYLQAENLSKTLQKWRDKQINDKSPSKFLLTGAGKSWSSQSLKVLNFALFLSILLENSCQYLFGLFAPLKKVSKVYSPSQCLFSHCGNMNISMPKANINIKKKNLHVWSLQVFQLNKIIKVVLAIRKVY